MYSSSTVTVGNASQQTQLAEASAKDTVYEGLHGSSDLVSLALGLESLQKSLTSSADRPRFELRSELGVGGQGVVLSVYDRDCGRLQALKVLHEHRSDRDGILRFIHEAQVMAQLEHPGVVPIHDLNVLEDGTLYYSMKRIEGNSLADLMDNYSKPENRFQALQVFLKVCDTLSYSHDRGVIHRDLKPANIMVGSYGEVLVVDWGLAKTMGDSEVQSPRDVNESGDAFSTRTGVAVGTPSSMSPEQARGESLEVDHCSDIFALGVILYEIVAGKGPYFPERRARKVMEQSAHGKWRPLDEINDAAIPAALQAIVEKAMSFHKQDRYQSAEKLADDVRSFIAGQAVSAHEETVFQVLMRFMRRHKTPLLAVAITAAIGAIVFFAFYFRDKFLTAERIEDLRTEASLAVADEAYEKAVASYQRLLELDPQDAEAAVNVGHYGALAQRLVAERSAAALRERNRSRAHSLADEAEQLMASGSEHLPHAVERLTQAMALVPADSIHVQKRFLPMRDQALRKIADVEKAEQRKRAETLIQSAEHLAKKESWIEAQVYLQQALQLVPSNDRTARLSTRITTGLESFQKRRQELAAERLLLEARQLQEVQNYPEAIARVQAVLALGIVEEASDLLAELLRERDQAAQRAQRQNMLVSAEQEIKGIDLSLADNDLMAAEYHYGRLIVLQDSHPELASLKDIPAIRQRIDQTFARLQETRAMNQVQAAREQLSYANQLAAQSENLQQELRKTEEALLQDPGAKQLRRRAHELSEKLHERLATQSKVLGEAVTFLNKAQALAPDHPPVRAMLAAFWAQRVVELERGGDAPAAAAAAARGLHYDVSEAHRLVFHGLSVVTLRTPNPIRLQRIEPQENRRDEPQGEVITLEMGKTMEIPHGRWLIQDGRGLFAAHHFRRGSTHNLSFRVPQGVSMESVAYIPEMPLFGISNSHSSIMVQSLPEKEVAPFFMMRHEVTNAQYLAFLNDPTTLKKIAQFDGNSPLSLVPRASWDSKESLWEFTKDRFVLRHSDRVRGTAIDPNLPVTGISKLDVDAYIAWRRAKDDIAWRLPTVDEWQVAAQGGDGRLHPWGNLPDNAMCYSYAAKPTQSGFVELPVGSFPGDRSVQGVYDLAGSVAEFVEGGWYGKDGISLALGGSFTDRETRRFTFSSRRAVDDRLPLNSVGFRLVFDAD